MTVLKALGSSRKGFTLVELMVALVLSFILVGAIYRSFTVQQKAYTIQDQIAEAQQNARMAMNILIRDIRMAGYGMPEGGITIGSPPNRETYTNAIQITNNGDGQPDSITLVGAFGAPSGYLARTVSPGSTQLFLRSSNEASNFDATDKRYIFIGGLDTVTILSVSNNMITLNEATRVRYPTAILTEVVEIGEIDLPVVDGSGIETGDVLSLGMETITVTAAFPETITVDTDLDTPGNQGITGVYPAGTPVNPIPVFRVTAVEYTLDPYYGSFTRADMAEIVNGGSATELAGNIYDIQIDPDDQADQSSYTVKLTARTKNPDPDYIADPQGYRKRVLQSRVALRNLRGE